MKYLHAYNLGLRKEEFLTELREFCYEILYDEETDFISIKSKRFQKIIGRILKTNPSYLIIESEKSDKKLKYTCSKLRKIAKEFIADY